MYYNIAQGITRTKYTKIPTSAVSHSMNRPLAFGFICLKKYAKAGNTLSQMIQTVHLLSYHAYEPSLTIIIHLYIKLALRGFFVIIIT